MLSLLSDILTNLSIRGTLYFRTSFTRPWGVEVPNYQNVARFHFAHQGSCRVKIDGVDDVVTLAEGDLIIIPHGASHQLFAGDDPERTVLPLDAVLEKSGYDGAGVLVYGGDVPDSETQLICGHFSFEPNTRHILMDRLPPFNALGAFSDKNLCRAMDAFHKAPAKRWTVEELAQAAGMSRTGFALQFQKQMLMSPMEYVTSWRMEIAKKKLRQGNTTLTDAAESAGYASDSAFTRAFKKETGRTPAEYRKSSIADRS